MAGLNLGFSDSNTTGNSNTSQTGQSTTNLDPVIRQQTYDNLGFANAASQNWQPTLQSAPVGFNANQQWGQQAMMNAAQGDPGGTLRDAAGNAYSDSANYNPSNVVGNGYTSQGFNGAQVDPATGQWSGAQMGPAAQATAAQGTATGYTAAQSKDAANGYNASQFNNAAQLANGSVNQVNGPNSTAQLSKYLGAVSPQFQSSVIQPALDAINQQRIQALQGADGQAAQAGAFGGDRQAIYDAQTNTNYANQAGQLAGSLGLQGFNAATGLMQQDTSLGQQAQLANQSTNLQAGTTNAGFQQQQGLSNQAALNQAGQFQATAQNAQAMQNAQWQNDAAKFGADAANQMAAKNAEMATAVAQSNATARNEQMLANQNSTNMGLGSSANNAVSVGQGNQQSYNQGAQFTSGAANNAAEFGANAGNAASAANAANGLTANGQRINAAGGMAATADQQRTDAFGNAAAGMGVGNQQQSFAQAGQDVQDANNAQMGNADLVRLGIRQSAMGMTPYGSTVNTSGNSNTNSSSNSSSFGGGLTLSDARLKTNMKPMFSGGALSKVKKLKGVAYNWKGSGQPDLGLIAQDVQKAMPGAVKTVGGGAKAYSTPAVLGLLAESVKELDRKVSRKGILS